jgi:hypothetical protein
MIKRAFFLGTMLFSFNAFASSIADLNSALHKANVKTARTSTKIIYGGQDIFRPQIADADKILSKDIQVQIG